MSGLDTQSYSFYTPFHIILLSASFTLLGILLGYPEAIFHQEELGGGGWLKKKTTTKHKTFPAQLFHKRTEFNCKVNWGDQSSSGCRQ